MAFVRMNIQSVVVGSGPVTSLVILKPRHGNSTTQQLPIRIGNVESAAISMAIGRKPHNRPYTHDLLVSTIDSLGAKVREVAITQVQGTTFFARIEMERADGEIVSIDARPSDALALAARVHAPIFVDDEVLETASMPNFKEVEMLAAKKDADAFHDFIEGLYPDDFASEEESE